MPEQYNDGWIPSRLGRPTFRTSQKRYTPSEQFDVDAIDIGVTTTLYLLQPGDELLWPDRKQPLTVAEPSERRSKAYGSGMWDPTACWVVEGIRGGQYHVANWWAWTDDQIGDLSDSKPWPNVHRTSSSSFDTEAKPDELAVWCDDGKFVVHSPHPDEFDEVVSVVYEKPARDRVYVGHVTGEEFGQLNVQRVSPFEVTGESTTRISPVDPIEEAIDAEDIVAFRTGDR